jgi:hypothetical protein
MTEHVLPPPDDNDWLRTHPVSSYEGGPLSFSRTLLASLLGSLISVAVLMVAGYIFLDHEFGQIADNPTIITTPKTTTPVATMPPDPYGDCLATYELEHHSETFEKWAPDNCPEVNR